MLITMLVIVFTILSLCCNALCGVCDNETLPYQIGIQTTLLDISADVISSLQANCSKHIVIRGASTSTIHVEEAGYARNMFYEYLGNNGVVPKFETDRAAILFEKCPSLNAGKNQNWLEVDTGFTHTFTGSSICLKFLPNKKSYAFIGGHEKGSRIIIRIIVNVGQCSSYTIAGPVDTQCVPLCSIHGLVRSCLTKETTPNASGSRTKTYTSVGVTTFHSSSTFKNTEFFLGWPATPTMTSGLYSTSKKFTPIHRSIATLLLTTPGIKQTTSIVKVSSTSNTNQIALPTQKNSAPTGKHSTTQTIGQSKPATKRSSTYQDSFFSGNIDSPTTAKVIRKITPTSRRLRSSESMSVVNPGNSLKGPAADESTTATMRQSVISSTTSIASTTAAAEDDTLFGFVEGLYMLFGCILLVLIVVGLACSVQRRRSLKLYPSTGSFNAPSTSGNIHWRDNWLVRYHSNVHPDDTLSQSESVQCIHGNFMNQSNPELHHIHIDGHRFRGRIGEGSTYEDPWPLVRLDPDFVNRTKSIERTISDEVPVGHALAKEPRSEECTLPSSELQANVLIKNNATDKYLFNSNYSTIENIRNQDTLDTISTEESARYKKREGSYSTTKGTYSVVKLIRRSSPKFENDVNDVTSKQTTSKIKSVTGKMANERQEAASISSTSETNTSTGTIVVGKSDVSYQELDDIPISRTRTSSSMRSECNLTFEDMLHKEIPEIELDMAIGVRVDLDDTDGEAEALQGNEDPDVNPMYATMTKHVGTFARVSRELDNNVHGTDTPSYKGGASGTMQFPK